MSEHNAMMAAMMAADAPAERDLRFEIALLARIEQRRFRRGVLLNVALAAAAAVLLALVMPGIEGFWQQSFALGNGTIAALLFAALLPVQVWIVRRV